MNPTRLAVFAALAAVTLSAQGPPTVATLYTGVEPAVGGLLLGSNGVLYGTTASGTFGRGIAYELTPPVAPGAAWTETQIYQFEYINGGEPRSPLITDKKGNLYGTGAIGASGAGLVFELIPPPVPRYQWYMFALHNFTGLDGAQPIGGLLSSPNEALYGTTSMGGAYSLGAVFQLTPPSAPGELWNETVLYSFGAQPGDGSHPRTGLIMDSAGNLYGSNGGVFELSPPATPGGVWTETILLPPTSNGPDSILSMDAGGDLYGTTNLGGIVNAQCSAGCGTVFKLAPPSEAGGAWTETILYSFMGPDARPGEGAHPRGGVIIGAGGILYGTAAYGGIPPAYPGIVFWLTPPSTPGGAWTETTVPLTPAEKNPDAGLIFGPGGVLYGNGINGVFQVTP